VDRSSETARSRRPRHPWPQAPAPPSTGKIAPVTYEAQSLSSVPVELHLHPGVPHEYDAIAFNADVSRRAQSDRDRVLRSL
jgi:hypothetical protein